MNGAEFVTKLITLSALAWLASACSQPLSVEQQVIAVIREMESSIEKGDRSDFIAHIDENFTGQDPLMTRDQLNAFIIVQLYRHEQLQAQFMPIYVNPEETGEAEAHFKVLLTGGQGWLPDSGQMLNFDTRWHQKGGVWLLRSASWQLVTIDPIPE
jgi:hypothetical protein